MREENIEALERWNPHLSMLLEEIWLKHHSIYVFFTNDTMEITQITKMCLQKEDVVHVIYHLGWLGVGGVRHVLIGVNNLHSN